MVEAHTIKNLYMVDGYKRKFSILPGFVLLMSSVVSPLCAANDLTPFDGQKGEIHVAGGTAYISAMKALAEQIIKYNDNI